MWHKEKHAISMSMSTQCKYK